MIKACGLPFLAIVAWLLLKPTLAIAAEACSLIHDRILSVARVNELPLSHDTSPGRPKSYSYTVRSAKADLYCENGLLNFVALKSPIPDMGKISQADPQLRIFLLGLEDIFKLSGAILQSISEGNFHPDDARFVVADACYQAKPDQMIIHDHSDAKVSISCSLKDSEWSVSLSRTK